MYTDETLVCKDCGKEFLFSAGEQEFYAQKGFENKPSRCKECRQAKKKTWTVPCAKCGADATVHFEPKHPVLCTKCYEEKKAAEAAE